MNFGTFAIEHFFFLWHSGFFLQRRKRVFRRHGGLVRGLVADPILDPFSPFQSLWAFCFDRNESRRRRPTRRGPLADPIWNGSRPSASECDPKADVTTANCANAAEMRARETPAEARIRRPSFYDDTKRHVFARDNGECPTFLTRQFLFPTFLRRQAEELVGSPTARSFLPPPSGAAEEEARREAREGKKMPSTNFAAERTKPQASVTYSYSPPPPHSLRDEGEV